MHVEVLNPEVLANLYRNHGQFACTCYNTPEQYAEKVGQSCEEEGHMSGSRCEYIKFLVTGLDRGTSEQCLRHEIGTAVPFEDQDNYTFYEYSELVKDVSPDQIVKNMASFRYIDKEGFSYEIPSTIQSSAKAGQYYRDLMDIINDHRTLIKDALIEDGLPEKRAVQDANFVLPRATTTEFVIGFTPEALIHFSHKRMCTRAQEFIHEFAVKAKKEVAKYNPKFAEELVPHCQHLLWCPEKKHSCHAYPTREELIQTLRSIPRG